MKNMQQYGTISYAAKMSFRAQKYKAVFGEKNISYYFLFTKRNL